MAGQSVTSAAQLVIVYVVVPYTVEVVDAGADVKTPAEVSIDVAGAEDASPTTGEVWTDVAGAEDAPSAAGDVEEGTTPADV